MLFSDAQGNIQCPALTCDKKFSVIVAVANANRADSLDNGVIRSIWQHMQSIHYELFVRIYRTEEEKLQNKVIPKNEKVSFVRFLSVCRADSDAARYIALVCFSVLLSLPRCFNGQREGEQKIPLALCALGECLASPFIAVLFIFLLNTVTWRSKRTRFERSDRVEIGERESG